jgi:hypothetical protein
LLPRIWQGFVNASFSRGCFASRTRPRPRCTSESVLPELGPEPWQQMNSPGASYREGWRPATLKAGDDVTVVVNPVRDGTHGGRRLGERCGRQKPKQFKAENMSVRTLLTLSSVLAALLTGAAPAAETAAPRALAFAALPNWTGMWETEAAARLSATGKLEPPQGGPRRPAARRCRPQRAGSLHRATAPDRCGHAPESHDDRRPAALLSSVANRNPLQSRQECRPDDRRELSRERSQSRGRWEVRYYTALTWLASPEEGI